MTRRTLLLAAALAGPVLSARDPIPWQPATVLHARYRFDNPIGGLGDAGGGGGSIARGEFDFDTTSATYTAEEQVAPQARLPLEAGDKVTIAVTGPRTLLLQLPNGKIRKLKLTRTYTKPSPKP